MLQTNRFFVVKTIEKGIYLFEYASKTKAGCLGEIWVTAQKTNMVAPGQSIDDFMLLIGWKVVECEFMEVQG